LQGDTIDVRHHKISWWNSARVEEERGKEKEERGERKHIESLSLYYSPQINSEHWTTTTRLSTMEFEYVTGGMEGDVANTGNN